jgi:mannose-6-phosphate isomerase-like protein (cupin superfamily)
MFPPLYLDIDKLASSNKTFRKTVYETHLMKITVMSIKPKKDIGTELHHERDQFIKVVKGMCEVRYHDGFFIISKGESIIIPKNTTHNVINLSETKPLKIYSIYAKTLDPYAE